MFVCTLVCEVLIHIRQEKIPDSYDNCEPDVAFAICLSHEEYTLQFVIKRFYKDDKYRLLAHDVTLDV